MQSVRPVAHLLGRREPCVQIVALPHMSHGRRRQRSSSGRGGGGGSGGGGGCGCGGSGGGSGGRN